MKGLILAAGKGTRLRPVTNTIAKPLLPVANKPILFYVLEQFKEAGINDIGIIVSPDTEPSVSGAVGDGSPWGARITCILQQKPLGLAHAVITARDFLGDSPFLMFLGDNLIGESVRGFVSQFNASKPDALILLKEVANPSAFGVAETDKDGKVIRLVEKPKEPKSKLAVVGIYIFTPEIHHAIDRIEPSRRGELEITDAIQKLIENGKKVSSHLLKQWWLDTGQKADLLEANRVILGGMAQGERRGTVDAASRLTGMVAIGEGTEVEASTIQGPVTIAEDCRIRKAAIGPNTSIGRGTVIEESSVTDSVILEGCSISHVDCLQDSLIGTRVKIKKGEGACRAATLFVGCDADLVI